jgi:D-glucuronyl C5-epimerase-like protein
MRLFSRTLALALVATALAAAPAWAGQVIVVDGNHAKRVNDPSVPSKAEIALPPAGGHAVVASAARSAPKKPRADRRAVYRALARALRSTRISSASYRRWRAWYASSIRTYRHLRGARRDQLGYVIDALEALALQNMLSPTRMPAAFVGLERNRRYWRSLPFPAARDQVSFKGSQVLYVYFPGEGLQLHPLANFGKLNALAGLKLQRDRMTKLMNELLPLAATRAGGLAWEYYFDFGGGAPPWVSSLSQGTALQSLARAATKAGVAAEVLPRLRRGLAVFKKRTPAGVRVPVAGPGDHYAQYSFAPGLRILNGFIQSLNGLYDFARLAADETARRLFEAGDARAKREVPTYDTGAWSLYSRGTSYHESSLEYHVLLRDFLQELCDRTQAAVHCRAAEHFTRYLDEAPVIRVLTHRLRAGRPGALRFRLSKISSVTVNLYRGGENVYSYSATLAFGRHALTIKPPRSAREYEVRIRATDLAGNTGDSTARVTVSRP